MRLCSGPGCGRAVPNGVRFCYECKPTAKDSEEIRTHQRVIDGYDAEIDRLNKGTAWQKLRARVIREQPLCVRCELRISEIVDHKVPAQIAISQARASGKYPLNKYAGYYLRSNLQGLCRPCHGVKTEEDKAHEGSWPDVVAIEAAAPKKVWTF